MTEGSLWKNILLFSIPLVFSQLLQVMFNMADVAVVGKFASDTALGSVGSTSTLVTLFTGFLIGMGNGVNVRVAQHLGAQHREETSRAVHTAFCCACWRASALWRSALRWRRTCWRCCTRRTICCPARCSISYLCARHAGARHLQLRQRGAQRERRHEAATAVSDDRGHF